MENSGFLKEDNGTKSFVRLQSLLLTILFMIVAGWEAYTNQVNVELLIILGALAVVPKVFQKFVEDKGMVDRSEKTIKSTIETKTETS